MDQDTQTAAVQPLTIVICDVCILYIQYIWASWIILHRHDIRMYNVDTIMLWVVVAKANQHNADRRTVIIPVSHSKAIVCICIHNKL